MDIPITPRTAPAERPGLLVYGLLMVVACCLPALLVASFF
tara:strand:+ start:182 stop:301 length:120 start_codon:yes stop_codon:yes gene_type:complete